MFQTTMTTTVMPTATAKTGRSSTKTPTTSSGSSRAYNNEQIASLTSITDLPPTPPSLFQTTTTMTTLPTARTATTVKTSSETALQDDKDHHRSLSTTASITDTLSTSSTLTQSQSTTTTTDWSATTSSSTSTRSEPVADNLNTCRPGYVFNPLTSTCEGDQFTYWKSCIGLYKCFGIVEVRRSIIRRRRSVRVESTAATHPRQAVNWQFQSRVEVVPPHHWPLVTDFWRCDMSSPLAWCAPL